jgi:hypothetical protein
VPLAPSGALRLRLRLRRAPGEPPAPEPASGGMTAADDAPSELLGEARGPSSSFISWSSAMDDLSASFAARDVPEDPEHPDGTGPESPAAVPRRAHVTPAGAAQAAAEGMLPLNADDVAREAAFPFAPPPSSSDEGIMLVESGAADVAEADPGGAGGGYALVSSPALWPSSGQRGGAASEEAWEEADAPDADGEDERRLYYGADVAMPQEYGSSSEDPYAQSDDDEEGKRIEGESSGAEESSGSDFDEEGNLVPKEP